ncbi:unnamed protein product [Vitrella brassicaformis CCMP3155]|uniref:Uncharacterized protein n=1 Tax=Vitrella brassicaformis (strain CCMP3155) TaxID=1169540 RepID=A0A0G4F239_VITBC|nr:unnamed protein product [Vitrella brassicaformis CCMP3155]|eukprot:CEM05815.1 unnamed protein product [Vitrella brassicaformis CCMP3155]
MPRHPHVQHYYYPPGRPAFPLINTPASYGYDEGLSRHYYPVPATAPDAPEGQQTEMCAPCEAVVNAARAMDQWIREQVAKIGDSLRQCGCCLVSGPESQEAQRPSDPSADDQLTGTSPTRRPADRHLADHTSLGERCTPPGSAAARRPSCCIPPPSPSPSPPPPYGVCGCGSAPGPAAAHLHGHGHPTTDGTAAPAGSPHDVRRTMATATYLPLRTGACCNRCWAA